MIESAYIIALLAIFALLAALAKWVIQPRLRMRLLNGGQATAAPEGEAASRLLIVGAGLSVAAAVIAVAALFAG